MPSSRNLVKRIKRVAAMIESHFSHHGFAPRERNLVVGKRVVKRSSPPKRVEFGRGRDPDARADGEPLFVWRHESWAGCV
jgi:hypothetical protein